jgi:hypothetical protein
VIDEQTEVANEQALTPLAARLDLLSTWLFFIAAMVVVLCVIAGVLALSTNIDSLGLLSPSADASARAAVGLALIGGGVAAGGVIAGLAGILKALVNRREL